MNTKRLFNTLWVTAGLLFGIALPIIVISVAISVWLFEDEVKALKAISFTTKQTEIFEQKREKREKERIEEWIKQIKGQKMIYTEDGTVIAKEVAPTTLNSLKLSKEYKAKLLQDFINRCTCQHQTKTVELPSTP